MDLRNVSSAAVSEMPFVLIHILTNHSLVRRTLLSYLFEGNCR